MIVFFKRARFKKKKNTIFDVSCPLSAHARSSAYEYTIIFKCENHTSRANRCQRLTDLATSAHSRRRRSRSADHRRARARSSDPSPRRRRFGPLGRAQRPNRFAAAATARGYGPAGFLRAFLAYIDDIFETHPGGGAADALTDQMSIPSGYIYPVTPPDDRPTTTTHLSRSERHPPPRAVLYRRTG